MPDGERLYKPEWFDYIDRGIPITFRYVELPVEELMILDEMSRGDYPGLRFNLRKQRGRGQSYLLTILPSRHLERDRTEVKGEP